MGVGFWKPALERDNKHSDESPSEENEFRDIETQLRIGAHSCARRAIRTLERRPERRGEDSKTRGLGNAGRHFGSNPEKLGNPPNTAVLKTRIRLLGASSPP